MKRRPRCQRKACKETRKANDGWPLVAERQAREARFAARDEVWGLVSEAFRKGIEYDDGMLTLVISEGPTGVSFASFDGGDLGAGPGPRYIFLRSKVPDGLVAAKRSKK